MRVKLAVCSALVSISGFAIAHDNPPLVPYAAVPPVQDHSLATVLEQLYQHRGVDFSLAPELAGDNVQFNSEQMGSNFNPASLAGYNFATVHDLSGALTKIVITGRNGDGAEAGPSVTTPGAGVLAATGDIPERFQSLPPSSISTLDFALEELFGVTVGDKTLVSLPTGQYSVVHDNEFEHPNGDKTWVGYLDGEGTDYRMVVTTGKDGSMGQIVTPQGLFRIESEGGKTWLIDVTAANLTPQTMLGDDLVANGNFSTRPRAIRPKLSDATILKPTPTPKPAPTPTPKPTPTPAPATASVSKVVVDLLAYYTPGFSVGSAATRLNHLVALANQAYIDSKINLTLRLVYSQQISYSETVNNQTALNDLTNSAGVFSITPALRTKYGADLVTVLRPFKYSTQGNCGTAWVNGANGSTMSRNLGFSAVSDGRDTSSSYYCTDLSMTHELGHNMGSVHDRAHSSFAGKYAYSYGNGKTGVFGTVMSYYSPQLGMFSNPATLCKGLPCGIANQADNARSINQIAATVAAFTPTAVK